MSAIRILAVLCLFLPAFDAPAHRLIEVNGSRVTEREIVSISVPIDDVVIIVPDRIFSDTEGAAQWHESFATGPPLIPQRRFIHANANGKRYGKAVGLAPKIL